MLRAATAPTVMQTRATLLAAGLLVSVVPSRSPHSAVDRLPRLSELALESRYRARRRGVAGEVS